MKQSVVCDDRCLQTIVGLPKIKFIAIEDE